MSDHPMIGRVTCPCLRMCISTCAPYSRLICQGYTAVIIIIINVVIIINIIIIIIIIIMIPWLFVGTGWIHVWQCRVPMCMGTCMGTCGLVHNLNNLSKLVGVGIRSGKLLYS